MWAYFGISIIRIVILKNRRNRRMTISEDLLDMYMLRIQFTMKMDPCNIK